MIIKVSSKSEILRYVVRTLKMLLSSVVPTPPPSSMHIHTTSPEAECKKSVYAIQIRKRSLTKGSALRDLVAVDSLRTTYLPNT